MNVRRELALLEAEAQGADVVGSAVETLAEDLAEVNAQLWEVEDALRALRARRDFGARFVALARSVYALNDERAALKRMINRLFDSTLVEEKSYAMSPIGPRSVPNAVVARPEREQFTGFHVRRSAAARASGRRPAAPAARRPGRVAHRPSRRYARRNARAGECCARAGSSGR